MSRPAPEELHDWHLDCQRRIAWGLVIIWCLGFWTLVAFAAVEAWPFFGTLNGCEPYSAAECQAFAAEGRG